MKHIKNRSVLSYHEFFYEKIGEEQFFEIADNKPYNMYFERPAMISELPNLYGKKVLDAGSAAGWYSEYMYKKGANVTAVDISENMLKLLRKRLGNKVNAIQGDIAKGFPFIDSDTMDIVVSSLTLDFIKDWDYVMSEFCRVLKKGGLLLFSVEHPYDNFSAHHLDTYFETINMEHEYDDFGEKVSVWFYKRPLQSMVMPVIENGFEIVKIEEPRPTDKFKDVCPELFEFYMQRPEYLIIKAVRK